MNRSLVRDLIVKDFQLHRSVIGITILAGSLGIIVLQFKGLTGLFGIIGFFTTLIVLGAILPHASIINERKGQNLAFLMSLPISFTQYTTAKILSALGMFMIPWLTLSTVAVSIIIARRDVPHGILPTALILIVAPLVGFCVMTAATLLGESEGWTIAATIAVNVSYSLCWPLVATSAELRAGLSSPTPVWSPIVFKILGAEFAAIIAILALTLYLQSKKKDFV
jgi:hypothetical protein